VKLCIASRLTKYSVMYNYDIRYRFLRQSYALMQLVKVSVQHLHAGAFMISEGGYTFPPILFARLSHVPYSLPFPPRSILIVNMLSCSICNSSCYAVVLVCKPIEKNYFISCYYTCTVDRIFIWKIWW